MVLDEAKHVVTMFDDNINTLNQGDFTNRKHIKEMRDSFCEFMDEKELDLPYATRKMTTNNKWHKIDLVYIPMLIREGKIGHHAINKILNSSSILETVTVVINLLFLMDKWRLFY